jgi:hypothetical protein
MLTKKNILLQQAATVRAARKLKQGKVLKATSITKKAVCSKKKMIPKVAQKAIPLQAANYMKAPPSKKISTTPATRCSIVRRSARVSKPKKHF